jgi:hypothetical protein
MGWGKGEQDRFFSLNDFESITHFLFKNALAHQQLRYDARIEKYYAWWQAGAVWSSSLYIIKNEANEK